MKSCERPGRAWRRCQWLALAMLVLWVPPAESAPEGRVPHIGYVYPAGGRQGTIVRVTAGGQFLTGVTNVYVSGAGVTASVIRHVKPLSKKQEQAVRARLNARLNPQRASAPEDLPELPEHPWLEGMPEMDAPQLRQLKMKLFDPKKQLNPQLAEIAEIEVTIAPDAPLGTRELRLGTRAALTNPLHFQVGRLPEISEPEPNPPEAAEDASFAPPVLLNGQIRPGEVDRFRLRAGKGQRILLDAWARRLIPYLADAVPGWFQATLTLYDADGREVAYADDYRFHPDPYLVVTIPADGEYQLEIRDAIYRGRDDFVYRIAVTEAPPEPDPVRVVESGNIAESIALPFIAERRIDSPGDIDRFQFTGRADEEIVAEIHARRRLGSPVDGLLRLVDEAGNTLEWNDDIMEKDGQLHRGPGLLTHHADPYLRTRLPHDGTYFICVEDAQGHGGDEYVYRLRITPPQPDFGLRVTPSSLSVAAGQTVPVEVYVSRLDGFDGEIELALVDAPPGFSLSGGRIAGDQDRLQVTLAAPTKAPAAPVALRFEGRARIGGRDVRRQAVPADDTMQAFLWRHLVPAEDLLVAVTRPRRPSRARSETGGSAATPREIRKP